MRRLRLHNEYGGPGPLTFPADHVPAIRVPKGGSSCANCMFVDAARHECKEPHYIEWKGSPKLPPLPLDEICSDWYDWPGSGSAPEEAKERYFVWPTNENGDVLGYPHGPLARSTAEQYAREKAREHSAYDRAVTLGEKPTARDFQIVAMYERRTGKQIG